MLTLYGGMITSMFDPLGESLKAMADSMPDLFSAFGMNQSGATLTEFLSNYLYGFLLVVFPMVFLILLANRLLTRYLDRGFHRLLLATPNRRSKLALTQAFVMVLLLFCLTLYMTGLLLGQARRCFLGSWTGAFLLLNAGLSGLYLFLSGLCFCTACLWSEPRLATGVGGACIAFVLLQMLSGGEKFEWLKYATPLTLFDPQGLITWRAFGSVELPSPIYRGTGAVWSGNRRILPPGHPLPELHSPNPLSFAESLAKNLMLQPSRLRLPGWRRD